jgi:hypothetical protein
MCNSLPPYYIHQQFPLLNIKEGNRSTGHSKISACFGTIPKGEPVPKQADILLYSVLLYQMLIHKILLDGGEE